MKWKKLTIETTTQAVDFISGLLAELGIEGIEVEDNVPLSEEDKEKMFIDILPELPEDDGTARVNCYLTRIWRIPRRVSRQDLRSFVLLWMWAQVIFPLMKQRIRTG